MKVVIPEPEDDGVEKKEWPSAKWLTLRFKQTIRACLEFRQKLVRRAGRLIRKKNKKPKLKHSRKKKKQNHTKRKKRKKKKKPGLP